MTEKDYLLNCLEEECIELAQCALALAHATSKAIRFGENDVYDNKPNIERINREFNDLIATAELLYDTTGVKVCIPRLVLDAKLMGEKRAKLLKYLEYSRALGIVDKPVNKL